MSFTQWAILLVLLIVVIVAFNYRHSKATYSRFESDEIEEPDLDDTEDIYHQTETFNELRRLQPISEN
jgi:hypothetical protein